MILQSDDLQNLAELADCTARAAGALIMQYRDCEVAVEHKAGAHTYASQVVTEVDRRSQDLILEALLPTCGAFDLGLLTEESTDDESRFDKDYFWCIDPMDGTLSFIEGKPGFAVSIALVARDGLPHIGVVYDPVEGVLYRAIKGQGLIFNGSPWQAPTENTTLTLFHDRSFLDQPEHASVMSGLETLAADLGYTGLAQGANGGAVLNACHVLEHAPACYFKQSKPESGGGSIWDFAATACIVGESRGWVSDIQGQPLALNRTGTTFMNEGGALFASDAMIAQRIKTMIRESF
ncbi:MAG: 3'-phosphoadenosine 5'-phosphosulfate (PAPS) 3'-phosphatase [Verrucomicrobiales bacterium]|jgi:myo-inositol-1(or 4)-monophosphatase